MYVNINFCICMYVLENNVDFLYICCQDNPKIFLKKTCSNNIQIFNMCTFTCLCLNRHLCKTKEKFIIQKIFTVIISQIEIRKISYFLLFAEILEFQIASVAKLWKILYWPNTFNFFQVLFIFFRKTLTKLLKSRKFNYKMLN